MYVMMYIRHMSRKYSIAEARVRKRLRGGFAAAYRSFLNRHALDEVGLAEDFAASLRDRGAGRSISL